jgi:hypothetical protein
MGRTAGLDVMEKSQLEPRPLSRLSRSLVAVLPKLSRFVVLGCQPCTCISRSVDFRTYVLGLQYYVFSPLSLSSFQLLNASSNLYETWYVYHVIRAYLSGAFHKSFPSVCVCICIIVSLLGNGSVKTLPWQRIHAVIELLDASFPMLSVSYQRKAGDSFFQALLVFS